MDIREAAEKINDILMEARMEGFAILSNVETGEIISTETLQNGRMLSQDPVPLLYGICVSLLDAEDVEACKELVRLAINKGFFLEFEERGTAQ